MGPTSAFDLLSALFAPAAGGRTPAGLFAGKGEGLTGDLTTDLQSLLSSDGQGEDFLASLREALGDAGVDGERLSGDALATFISTNVPDAELSSFQNSLLSAFSPVDQDNAATPTPLWTPGQGAQQVASTAPDLGAPFAENNATPQTAPSSTLALDGKTRNTASEAPIAPRPPAAAQTAKTAAALDAPSEETARPDAATSEAQAPSQIKDAAATPVDAAAIGAPAAALQRDSRSTTQTSSVGAAEEAATAAHGESGDITAAPGKDAGRNAGQDEPSRKAALHAAASADAKTPGATAAAPGGNTPAANTPAPTTTAPQAALSEGTVAPIPFSTPTDGLTQTTEGQMLDSGLDVAPLRQEGPLAAPRNRVSVLQSPQAAAQDFAALVRRNVDNGASRFEIRLDPPELGRIDVKLDIDAQGRASAHLSFERTDALDMMSRDARALEKALADAGFDMKDGALAFEMKDRRGGEAENEQAAQTEAESDANSDTPDTPQILAGRSGVDIRI
ncbi:MAG: flagellar hook-length control protein FliK [Pseudomonadota bacterium]